MKSVFLGGGAINDVYSQKTIDSLVKEAGLVPTILTRDDALAGKASDADFIFSTWGMPHFSNEEVKACFPNAKAVFYGAGSVQAFAKEFIQNGIKVFSAWGANAVPVAEFSTSLITLANKGFFRSFGFKSLAEQEETRNISHSYCGNFDCSVGIIGAGMIGTLVIKMLSAYRINVKVFDPFMPQEKAEALGVKLCSLEEIFSTCQTISNHLADNAQTAGMLNYSLFSIMKDNATFINTGRGKQVIEADLIRALEEKPERMAILDVTHPEPPVENSPLFACKNIILTPHMAGSTGDEVKRMSEFMLEEFHLYIKGEKTRYEVTEKMLYTMA